MQRGTEEEIPIQPLLQRSVLYAPLAAYDQTKVSPAEYTRLDKGGPKREAQLVDFLQHVSNHRHYQPNGLHAKGAKPFTKFQDRLQNTTLMIVGCPSKISRKKPPPKKAKQSVKVGRTEEAEKIDPAATDRFVDKMNAEWNKYAQKAIRVGEKIDPKSIEWVGSWVRLHSSAARKDWIGCEGILVKETKNAWQLWTKIAPTRRKKAKLLLVPKHLSTVLEVRIPSTTGDEIDGKQAYQNLHVTLTAESLL